MNLNTPLKEVAQFLPADIAEVLMRHDTTFQVRVLGALRVALVAMEDKGANLDPVNHEAVVYGMGLLAIHLASQDNPSSNGGSTA